jgi:prefoldin subunit 5
LNFFPYGIDNLVEHVKKLNQAIAKISTKINQIKDICEEYELDFEEFITLNYDFDE